MNEGQTWEAIQSASHYNLGNLVALIDLNGLTQHGPTDQIMNIEAVQASVAQIAGENS